MSTELFSASISGALDDHTTNTKAAPIDDHDEGHLHPRMAAKAPTANPSCCSKNDVQMSTRWCPSNPHYTPALKGTQTMSSTLGVLSAVATAAPGTCTTSVPQAIPAPGDEWRTVCWRGACRGRCHMSLGEKETSGGELGMKTAELVLAVAATNASSRYRHPDKEREEGALEDEGEWARPCIRHRKRSRVHFFAPRSRIYRSALGQSIARL
ncbi:hypothetical protein C8R44DRAFT_865876 [Mycena epipterygia]|nr:hypothetical protein C8R44DRAFT_865876 [Mycena epipterygia]